MVRTKIEFGLVGWAMDHKKVVYPILALLIIVGVIGLYRMNRDEFPPFEIKSGLVAAVYPGASAEEVRDQLAKPLEQVLFSIPEVSRTTLKSYSKDGICYLYVDIIPPAEKKDQVWSKIRHRLDAAKLTLPAGVAAIVVLDDFSETSSLLIAMESEDKGYTELLGYAEDLCARLRRIPTLSKADVLGAQQEEIAVNLDLDRLSMYGISPAQLMLDYQTSTLSASGGTLKAGGSNFPVHVTSTVTDEREIEDRVVYTDPSGAILRLGDIGTIERRYKSPAPYVSYNGNNALVVNVSMYLDNNIVAFGREVETVLSEFREDLPESVKMSRITDQPKVVGQSIRSFLRDLLISMLVVIFVMLMLFPLRSALIAGSGVPVCTALTLAVMYICGMRLNTVTLAALIVVLGMIVDDSIITMDGYMDKLGRRMGRREAAIRSSRELFMPMFMATFAISAMFFPTKVLIHGYLGEFVTDFPWVVAIALGFSLVYAMLVVPSLETRFISSPAAQNPSFIGRMQNRFFAAMQKTYDKAEAYCFRRPAFTMALGVIAVALGLLMFSRVNIQMLPKLARDCFAVEITLDNNASLQRTSQVADSLTALLLSDSDRIVSVTSFVGQSAPRFHCTYSPSLPGDNVAQLIVNTKSNKATVAALRHLEDKYEYWFPDAVINFKQMDYAVTGAVSVTLKGAGVDCLKPYADSIRNRMYSMDDTFKWIHGDCDNMVSGIRVDIDQDEASRLGVNRAVLSLALGGMNDGYQVASLYEEGRQVPVNVYCQRYGEDPDFSSLSSALVPGSLPYGSVPLERVADVRAEWNYPQLPRLGGEDCVTVAADLRMGKSYPEAMKKLRKYIDGTIRPELPDGVEIVYGGLDESNDMVLPDIICSFIAAVTVLFLFLLFHFKKVGIAVLTMVLSLLCLFGASLGIVIFGMDFTITAVLGLISLVGIIVRNGIIMFEYAEELRFEKGYSVRDAALLAGQRRMRPIFLTSCTTALGVLPMILSGDLMWMPMGIIIAFGTMLSIWLIVLVMPVSYWLVFRRNDDASSPSSGAPAIVKTVAPLALLILMPVALSAQNVPDGASELPREMGLQQCLDLSSSNDPMLRNARLDISIAQERRNEALCAYLPDVSIQAGAFYSPDPLATFTINDIPIRNARLDNIRGAVSDFVYRKGFKPEIEMLEHGYFASTVAIQPLYAGGRIINGNRLASLGVDAAEMQLEMNERDTRQKVESEYWLVVSLQEKMKALESGRILLDTLYSNVLSARSAGLAIESDVEQVAIKRREISSAAVKLKGSLRLAKINLFNSIGLECPFRQLDSITFTDRIDVLEDPAVTVESLSESIPVESQLLDAKVRSKRLEKKIAVGEFLPQVGLGGICGYNEMYPSMSVNRPAAVAFASVKIPITGLGKVPARVRQYNSEVQKALNEKQYADSQLHLRRQKMLLDLQTAYENALVSRETFFSAENAAARLEADYEAGRTTLAEMLKARLDSDSAFSEYVDRCMEYRNALCTVRLFY